MIRPFLLTLAFLVSIAALTGRKHPTSASGPMGIGDDAEAELVGVEVEGLVLIGDGDAGELDGFDHGVFLLKNVFDTSPLRKQGRRGVSGHGWFARRGNGSRSNVR